MPEGACVPRARVRPGSLLISEASARFVAEGHPWVLRDADTGPTEGFEAGDIVPLCTRDGRFHGRALIDPDARIVARVVTRRADVLPDGDFFRKRAESALGLRRRLNLGSSCYRLIHGEADGFPGLAVDVYNRWLVIQLYTKAADGLARRLAENLMALGIAEGACLKFLPSERRGARPSLTWVKGGPGPETMIGIEEGMKVVLRPFSGFGTGFFADQRDNRRLASRLAANARVLNAFAHTGTFSVACALGGGRVDSLDRSAAVLDEARDNFVLNQLDPSSHDFIAADVFAWMKACRPYDLIIMDPPTFSTHRGRVWNPRGLRDLAALSFRALVPGGLLMFFSNYRKLSEDALLNTLRAAVEEDIRVVQALGAAPDFPVKPGFPESRQLKGFLVQKLG